MEIEVLWDEDALSSIEKTFNYVKQFSPQNASRLAIQLVDFGNNLFLFPDKFKLCERRLLAIKGFHCVTFRNHIFIYKATENKLRIYKVFHAKQNPAKFKV